MKTREERSAGGVVVRERDGARDVAIIRTREGRWQLPKGWIEDGEDPQATAQREVREEAGVEGEVVGPIGSVEYWFTSRYDSEPARVHKLVQFFLMFYTRGSTDDHDDEVLEARWVPIDEALHMLAFKDERRMVTLAQQALQAEAAEK